MCAKPPTVSLVCLPGLVWQAVVDDPQTVNGRLVVDSPAWFAWLEETSSSFTYPVLDAAKGYIAGFMTVRKEGRQRGGQYWVAYRRCQGRLRKRYLGASRTLTQACLDQVAQTFLRANQAVNHPTARTKASD